MQIAVIGGGIAGLAAAWWLARAGHAVALFERHAEPGFVAHSVSVEGVRVDVPLRVFYPGYYPTLMRLYAELGVATQPVSYASSFVDGEDRLYFRWRNLRLGGFSLPWVLPQDLHGRRARRIVAGALHFRRVALQGLARGQLQGLSLGDFIAQHALPGDYVEGLLLPALATIATCTLEDARHYPAEVVAGYLAAGLARQSVRRARHGADDVAARLLAGIPRMVCNAGIEQLRVRRDGVDLLRAGGVQEHFDHAVLATQANHALDLWPDAPAPLAQALAGFGYRALAVVMHRDDRLMPPRRADWSPVNARVCPQHERPESTIWVNAVQPGLRRAAPVFQTVQPQREPRDALVIARARFERPLVDTASQQALVALQAWQAGASLPVSFCGSYAESGVPLLESAVRSAAALVERLQPPLHARQAPGERPRVASGAGVPGPPGQLGTSRALPAASGNDP
jgi:predicted NAD/FAD-binding protein